MIIRTLKTSSFSLATDGSTDFDSVKLYPLVARYYDQEVGSIVCVLLSLIELDGPSTGENIFCLVFEDLKTKGIPWSNMLSFAMDNANVMAGMKNGVAGFINRDYPHVYFVGCACHLIHLAAQKGGKKLQAHLDYTIDDILIVAI